MEVSIEDYFKALPAELQQSWFKYDQSNYGFLLSQINYLTNANLRIVIQDDLEDFDHISVRRNVCCLFHIFAILTLQLKVNNTLKWREYDTTVQKMRKYARLNASLYVPEVLEHMAEFNILYEPLFTFQGDDLLIGDLIDAIRQLVIDLLYLGSQVDYDLDLIIQTCTKNSGKMLGHYPILDLPQGLR